MAHNETKPMKGNAMFKRHSLQVKVVKDTEPTPVNDEAALARFDKINEIVKEQTKNVAIAIVGVAAVLTTLHTASEIAINAAPKR